jgi:hypothetical protein
MLPAVAGILAANPECAPSQDETTVIHCVGCRKTVRQNAGQGGQNASAPRNSQKKPWSSRSTAFALRRCRSLRNSNLSWLDVLGLRQSQRQNALLDLGADFVSIDGRVELEGPPEVLTARLMMHQRALNCGQ